MKTKLLSKCRCCISNYGVISLFTDISYDIRNKLLKCVNIKIEKDDGLPDQICKKCYFSLESAYNFIIQCENIDEIYHKSLQSKGQYNISENYILDQNNENLSEIEIIDTSIKELYFIDNNELVSSKCNKEKIESLSSVCNTLKLPTNEPINVVASKPEEFTCFICDRKFMLKGTYKRHIEKVHRKELSHVCEHCDERFSTYNLLEQHYLKYCNKKYCCDICGKRVTTSGRLELHKKHIHIPNIIKESKIEYLCQICGKLSGKQSVHDQHLQTHTDSKPLECCFCQKRFRLHNSLYCHIRIHTGEKPFKCGICAKSFRQEQQVKTHRLTHSGLKEHRCKFCLKAFALKGNLVVHERLHTGETPYKCTTCGKQFQSTNALKKHKHAHD